MEVVVAGAGVNPADSRWGFLPLLPSALSCWNGCEGLVAELSFESCATGLDGVQLSPSQIALADDSDVTS